MKHNMDAFINPRYDRKKVRVSSENQKPDKQLLEQLVDLHDELSIKFKLHVSSCHMNVNFCKYFQNFISHENSSPKFQLSIFVSDSQYWYPWRSRSPVFEIQYLRPFSPKDLRTIMRLVTISLLKSALTVALFFYSMLEFF